MIYHWIVPQVAEAHAVPPPPGTQPPPQMQTCVIGHFLSVQLVAMTSTPFVTHFPWQQQVFPSLCSSAKAAPATSVATLKAAASRSDETRDDPEANTDLLILTGQSPFCERQMSPQSKQNNRERDSNAGSNSNGGRV